MFSITTKQRCAWLKAIYRDDLTDNNLSNVFVCEMHYEQRKNVMLSRNQLLRVMNFSQVNQHIM